MKRRVENAVTIFVTAPVEELERRLRERATESSGVIDERIETAQQQLELQDSSTTWSKTTTASGPQTTSAAIVARELDRAATMARP